MSQSLAFTYMMMYCHMTRLVASMYYEDVLKFFYLLNQLGFEFVLFVSIDVEAKDSGAGFEK